MRSLFASLALTLAPRFLTYTQTLAPAAAARAPGLAQPHIPPKPAAAEAPLRPLPERAALPPHAPRPPLRRLHLLGAHRSAPVSPTLRSQSRNRFFLLLTTHRLPSLFFPRSPRDLLWGWAPQHPCLCFPGASASWQHLAGNRPAGQICNRDLGLGELVPPQAPDPLPHSCRPEGRTSCLPTLQPSLFSQPRPLLPLGCARGTPVLAAAKISHQQAARESGKPETGTDEVKGLREGEAEKGRQRAAGSGP